MNVLGLFGPSPNPSAALLVDGKLTAFIEEERLNRIKTAPNHFPIQAARVCMAKAGLSIDDIDRIAFGWDSERYVAEVPEFFRKRREEFGDTSAFNRLAEESNFNMYHPERIRHVLQLGLAAAGKFGKLPPIKYFPHHLCHAASAYYCSGFDVANILTIDGSGEEFTTLLAKGEGGRIETVKTFLLPHTLGGFYATFTEFVGFKPYQDEGKLMGLASYGKYDAGLQTKLDSVLRYDRNTGDFEVNPAMRYVGSHTFGNRFTDDLVKLFGPPRPQGVSATEAPYRDIAFAVQWRLEQVAILLARQLHRKTGLEKLCLGGGVAMNCVMNGKLAGQDFVKNIFAQPAASDNGTSLGAALLMSKELGEKCEFRMEHLYYGTRYSAEEIERALVEAKVCYRKSANICKDVARYLADGKLVGWFQGDMEVGARALGNRSILGNPLLKHMKDKLNLEVKHRESWRPFCPSLKEEHYREYIEAKADSPFMIMAFPVVSKYKDLFPSCVHVDGTVRPQAVSRRVNPRYWELIDEFEKLTGYGIIINTSFNVQGEPVVCSPRDALRCFGGTGLDVLAMGDFLVVKGGQSVS